MSVREIQAFLAESYGTEVSPDFISSVTDEVMTETIAWQNRPLEAMYPVVFFDALRVKIRDDGGVSNKAVYLALGVQADGQRDVLGLWVEQTEGAKFWLKVFNDLKTRGCQDILIAVVDGLKGLADAIGTAFPRTTVQNCIVHLIRNSLDYAGWKDRKAVAAALRRSTRQPARRLPNRRYRHLPTGYGGKVPDDRRRLAAGLGERHAVLRLPARHQASDLTTNAIESLNMQLRKIIKTRGHFPDEAAIKLLWLALRNVLAKSVRATFDWKAAMNQFAILFGERFTKVRG